MSAKPTRYLVATFKHKKRDQEVKYRQEIDPRQSEENNLIDLCRAALEQSGPHTLALRRWIEIVY